MRLRLHQYPSSAVAEVTLSRRNLLALLHKLEMSGSARTLVSEDCPEGLVLVVRSEEDDEHYGARSLPPGPLHPSTEAFINSLKPPEELLPTEDEDPDEQELPAGVERPDPGYFRHEILAQGEVWFDRFGRLHQLNEMPFDYLSNVISFLERRAARLYLAELVLDLTSTLLGQAEEKSWRAPDFEEPLEWLRHTPLLLALSQAADERVGWR
jgi:hypothetical protein